MRKGKNFFQAQISREILVKTFESQRDYFVDPLMIQLEKFSVS